MINKRMRTDRRKMFVMCLLLATLSMLFTSCDGHFLALDCIGASGYCGPVTPTPDASALEARARTITAGKPLVTDPLSAQDGYNWAVGGGCSFRNSTYYITNTRPSGGTYLCGSGKLSYEDAAIAMDVTLLSGNLAGILFRASPDLTNLYEFLVGNGHVLMAVFVNNSIVSEPIPIVPSSAVHGGTSVNRLLVIAQGDDFQYFVNGIFVGEVHDPTLPTAGFIGMGVDYDTTGTAQFANLAIYAVG